MGVEVEELDDTPNEEEMVERIAEALQSRGLDAGAQDTGGGMYCVVVPRSGGGEIIWSTADVNWGGRQ